MNGKIALEEHFNLPDFSVPQYVNAETMREISRRLLDVTAMRLGEMDAAGIDYSLLSLNSPGVQAEPDRGRGVASAGHVNDTLAQVVAANPSRYGGGSPLPPGEPA